MFTYFNQYKLRYEKGQMVPIFIVVLVVLIIMALATVNLAKIGLTKTGTSNGADAGALAGGTVMANVFNALAVANQEMIVQYEMFIAEMGVLAAVTIGSSLVGAALCTAVAGPPCLYIGTCCIISPGCQTSFSIAEYDTIAMGVSLTAFEIAQEFTYLNMQTEAENGRTSAIDTAQNYAFINSNLGTSLIAGLPPTSGPMGVGGQANAYDYSQTFNNFLRRISKSADSQTNTWIALPSEEYDWTDGQGRAHAVHVDVNTQSVDTFQLQYTLLPSIAISAALYFAQSQATTGYWMCAACGPSPACTSLEEWANAAEISAEVAIALAGLAPGWVMPNSLAAEIFFPICWVVDIGDSSDPLYRKFSATAWETQQGFDYGIGKTSYPTIESKSLASFQSPTGAIYPPNPTFDSEITAIDNNVASTN